MATSYFGELNYTLANEDTALEVGLLGDEVDHVLSVAGSGGRALPLLARAPRKLTCVDVSQAQLHLTQLRIEALRAFERDEFLAFFGYPPFDHGEVDRARLFGRIRLTEPARAYFLAHFEKSGWRSPLYDGRWEQTFTKLSRVNRRLTGGSWRRLFEARNLDEQRRIVASDFSGRRFRLFLAFLAAPKLFDMLLYKGKFPKVNIPESQYRLYVNSFGHLFENTLARENFFLQIMFYGRVAFPEGVPVECEPSVFERAKRALATTAVAYRQGDVITAASEVTPKIDFFSLSDVPSYFSGATESGFLQSIRPNLSDGALVVVRSYLHVPRQLDTRGYRLLNDRYRSLFSSEKVQVYKIDVYQRTPE